MNRVILMGRLTRDPDIRYSQGDNSSAVARYTIAVDRVGGRTADDGQPTADFISCVAFGRTAEFAEKYLKKGTKIAIEGHIRTGSYERDGQRVYTTDVVVDRHEFCEGRNGGDFGGSATYSAPVGNGGVSQSAAPVGDFMNIPEGIEEELPFN